MTTNIESLTVTVDVAGKMLGISRPTAFKRVNDGSIPSIRLGGRILISKARLEAMLNGQIDGNQAIHKESTDERKI